MFAVFIILISPSSDTESAEAADGAKDEKDAEAATPETSDEEPVINNNTTKKSVTARYDGSVSEPLCSSSSRFSGILSAMKKTVSKKEKYAEAESEVKVPVRIHRGWRVPLFLP